MSVGGEVGTRSAPPGPVGARATRRAPIAGQGVEREAASIVSTGVRIAWGRELWDVVVAFHQALVGGGAIVGILLAGLAALLEGASLGLLRFPLFFGVLGLIGALPLLTLSLPLLWLSWLPSRPQRARLIGDVVVIDGDPVGSAYDVDHELVIHTGHARRGSATERRRSVWVGLGRTPEERDAWRTALAQLPPRPLGGGS